MKQQGRRPLRVGMVHYSDYHLDSRIQRLAGALAERGDEVDLICLSPPGEFPVGSGIIRTHQIGGDDKAAGGARNYLVGYGRFFAAALARLSRLELRRRFDVVEAHNMPDALAFCGVLPRVRGAALILNVHDTFPELFATKFNQPADGRAVRLMTLQERLSAAIADRVICVTPEAAERLEARGAGRGRTAVVMNTPDERVFGPRRAAAGLRTDGPLRALYHGGLAPRFGVELLIRAFALLDDVGRLELRICGTGSEHAELIRLAGEIAPGRVDIAPRPVPFSAIPAELERADLGIVPTLRDPFTELLLPVKLLEYVHMGLPAIAPRLPVIERYFSGDTVALFDPGDAASLARSIRTVLDNPERSSERAAAAGERLDGIAWDQQRAAYLQLVDELADPHARSARRGTLIGGRGTHTDHPRAAGPQGLAGDTHIPRVARRDLDLVPDLPLGA
jgi:glycosyltransferase involved in cell wall biosynthesis